MEPDHNIWDDVNLGQFTCLMSVDFLVAQIFEAAKDQNGFASALVGGGKRCLGDVILEPQFRG